MKIQNPLHKIRQLQNKVRKANQKLLLPALFLLGTILPLAIIAITANNQASGAFDPIMHWKLNEARGTTANDASNNSNSGTISGATWSTPDLCYEEYCLSLDGSNDYITRADDADLDFAAADSFTIETWFRIPQKTTGTDVLIAKFESTGADGGYKLYMDEDGDIICGIDDDNTSFPEDSAASTTADYDDATWHQALCIKNGTTSLTLYIDGKQIAQDSSISSTGTLANNDAFYVGIDGNGTANPWGGFIDETKVFRSAATASQVETEFKKGSANIGGNNTVTSNGLIGYWKLDESSGNASDSSGNSLTLTNNGTTTYTYAKFGNGTEHVPASSQYLSTATTINSVKSVSFWVNPDSTTNYFISLTSSAYITSSSGTISATGFTSPRIYVDGSETSTLIADVWQLVTVTTDTAISADQFYVGRQGSNYFDGTLDEVRLFNRALSPQDVENLYNFAPGPVGYWKFEESTGTSAYDSSGNGFTGTLTSGPTWTVGKVGAAINFDGSNDYVSIADDDKLDVQAFTLSAWIKGDSWGTGNDEDRIVFKGTGSHSGNSYTFDVRNSRPVLSIDGDSPATDNDCGSTEKCVFVTSTISTGTWYHVTATFDGSTGMRIYLDGELNNTNTLSSAQTVDANSSTVKIGARSDASDAFDGVIDEVKIYNYVRTPQQIIEDMNAGHPAGGSPVGSQSIYFKFDEMQGTTVNNSGNKTSITGTVSGASWSNDGYLKSALNFDGTDDVVTVTNSDSIDLNEDLAAEHTFSAWFYADSDGENDTGEIYQKGTTTYLRVDSQSGSNLDVEASLDLATADANVNVSAPITINAWNHVAVTYKDDSDDEIDIYINGVHRGTSSGGSGAPAAENNSLLIGGSTSDNFDGKIDEFKIYNSALSAEQVKLEYNMGKSLVLGYAGTDSSGNPSNAKDRFFCPPGDTTATCAPIGYWNFETGTGSTAYDTSTTGANGTLTGNATWDTGKVGKAVTLDGTGDYVTMGTNSAYNFTTGDFSITAWIYLTAAIDNYDMIVNRGEFWSNGWYWQLTNDNSQTRTLMFSTNQGFADQLTQGSTTINLNEWTHIAMRRSGTDVDFFVNGIEETTYQQKESHTDPSSANRNLRVGTNSGADDVFLQGLVDELKIFNYDLTSSQIAWEYSRGKPTHHYKLDDCTGTTINDSEGTNTTGTLTIGASGSQTTVGTCSTSGAWFNGAAGKRNYSISLDGTDDQISLGATSTLEFGSDRSFSISAWVKPDATDKFIFFYGDTDDQWYGIQYTSASKFSFDVDDDVTKTNTVTPDTYSTGSWYHVVAVRDRESDQIRIYVNGIEEDTSTDNTGSVDNSTQRTTYIGRKTGTGSGAQYFDGLIDDVRVFNYPLTLEQVQTVMKDGALRWGPSTGAP